MLYSQSLELELKKNRAAQLTYEIQELTKKQRALNDEAAVIFQEASGLLDCTKPRPLIHPSLLNLVYFLFSLAMGGTIMGSIVYYFR